MSATPEQARRGSALQRIIGRPLARVAIGMLLALVVVASAGRALTEWAPAFDPTTVRLADKFIAPLGHASPDVPDSHRPWLGRYVLGTDELGRDVFSRMLQGASISLLIGLVAVGISVTVGTAVGALSGYYAKHRIAGVSPDSLLMRFTDLMLCFPTFFLILTVVALLPPSIYNIMIVIGLTSWMTTARFVRAEFLALEKRDFVLAARAMGLPSWRIMFFHMLPNALPPVFVTATLGVAGAILTESALSFLGFGVQPPFATWGNILSDGKNYVFDAPWLFFVPGSAIVLVVLAFNLLGECLREALSPKLAPTSP